MASTFVSLGICGLFCAVSAFCTLYNKHIFEHVYKSSNCLLLMQNLITIAVLLLGRAMGAVRFSTRLDRSDVVCGLCYGLNTMAGLWSLVFVNIVMFGALKRCTVVTSWLIEYLFTPTATTKHSLMPILVMCVGTVLAGCFDHGFTYVGYALAVASCVAQASAFELGRRLALDASKGIVTVLFANSVVSVCLQVGVIAATGEYTMLLPRNVGPRVPQHFLLNAVSVLLLNYLTFLNCSVNSPLVHSVAGNVKVVVTSGVGVVLFGARLGWLGWVGVAGNFVGAAWFSDMKLRAKAKEQRAKEQAVSSV
jgi:hypothetical protein